MEDMKNPDDFTNDDIRNELKFCVDVGQNLFNQVIKETNGSGPRVVLSTAVLLLALCDGKEGVLDAILEGVRVLDEKVEQTKAMMMAEARQSPLN